MLQPFYAAELTEVLQGVAKASANGELYCPHTRLEIFEDGSWNLGVYHGVAGEERLAGRNLDGEDRRDLLAVVAALKNELNAATPTLDDLLPTEKDNDDDIPF